MTTQARQSTELRQAEIIATMLHLAAERNPADITTTDIAKAMRVTQGALFRHFATKEAIRLAVVEWIEAQLLGALLAARQAAPDALAALRAMFLAHVRFAQAYPGVPRLIFAELQQAEASPVRLVVHKIMQRYRQVLAETLALAMAAKRIRADVDCQAAASLFLGGIQGLVIQSMLSGSDAALERQAEAVLDLYLAGLGGQS
ncbi:MAG TPA: TetR/AcrR family transcriptional regulator [Azonexus sp.]|nr:TetR/AcrR family transcriptional regulator [Azonexus sp.]